jgi:two-component system NarL family sensor kinase
MHIPDAPKMNESNPDHHEPDPVKIHRRGMSLKLKLGLLCVVPVLVALAFIAVTVRQQTLRLAHQERQVVESAYLHSKETELRHYVQLAQSAVTRTLGNGQDVAEQKRQALALLSQMQFGKDGYFFVYDRDGTVLLDAQQMGLQGVDLCDPNNPVSAVPATLILETARKGGGVVRYQWQKPSSQQSVPKLGYVVLLPEWGWALGTGLYLDDVDEALRQIDAAAHQNIDATRQRIYAIAAICIVLIGAAGMALNLSDHRTAATKLRRLAQRVVHSQEEERVRVARELHDGVVQVLVSSKFMLETAHAHLSASPPSPQTDVQQPPRAVATPRNILEQGLHQLNHALQEIRRVSHGLRPALLDDLGLPAALALMAQEVSTQSPLQMRFAAQNVPEPLPTGLATALFRVVQEAVNNAVAHAGATQIDVALRQSGKTLTLSIQDNGHGFDVDKVQRDGHGGIGLRNMRERIEGLGGAFALTSHLGGTRIEARVTHLPPAPGGIRPHSLHTEPNPT